MNAPLSFAIAPYFHIPSIKTYGSLIEISYISNGQIFATGQKGTLSFYQNSLENNTL